MLIAQFGVYIARHALVESLDEILSSDSTLEYRVYRVEKQRLSLRGQSLRVSGTILEDMAVLGEPVARFPLQCASVLDRSLGAVLHAGHTVHAVLLGPHGHAALHADRGWAWRFRPSP